MASQPEQYVNLSRYDFLVIFIGFIGAMAIERLLAFVAHLLSHRDTLRIAPTHAIYLILIGVAQVFYWWTLWEAKAIAEFHFISFASILLPPLLTFLATSVLCPEPGEVHADHLPDYFFTRCKPFFLLLAAVVLVSMIQGSLLWQQPAAAMIVKGLGLIMLLLATRIRSRSLHLLLALALLGLMLTYMIGSHRLAPTHAAILPGYA